jgi:hypothetical protein
MVVLITLQTDAMLFIQDWLDLIRSVPDGNCHSSCPYLKGLKCVEGYINYHDLKEKALRLREEWGIDHTGK